MISVPFLKTKLNKFSTFDSLLYGLWCGLMAAPEIYGNVIGRTFCFLSGVLFFFVVYVFFLHNRDFAARVRKNKFTYIGIFIVCWAVLVNGSCLMYMYVYKVPSEVAIEKVALAARTIGYYVPFLP